MTNNSDITLEQQVKYLDRKVRDLQSMVRILLDPGDFSRQSFDWVHEAVCYEDGNGNRVYAFYKKLADGRGPSGPMFRMYDDKADNRLRRFRGLLEFLRKLPVEEYAGQRADMQESSSQQGVKSKRNAYPVRMPVAFEVLRRYKEDDQGNGKWVAWEFFGVSYDNGYQSGGHSAPRNQAVQKYTADSLSSTLLQIHEGSGGTLSGGDYESLMANITTAAHGVDATLILEHIGIDASAPGTGLSQVTKLLSGDDIKGIGAALLEIGRRAQDEGTASITL